MTRAPRIRIRSGGQTGVDRAALDFAAARGIESAGWCPRGGWAEDEPAAPGVRRRYPQLVETPSPDPAQRTAWNVRDSHATLILTPAGTTSGSRGTAFTLLCAELVFVRPVLVVALAGADAPRAAAAWLQRTRRDCIDAVFDLDVAGPRESQAPGIRAQALHFLAALWALLDEATATPPGAKGLRGPGTRPATPGRDPSD